MLADKHLYIADGHHRYTTCLNYRKEIIQALRHRARHDHPANFCLFVLIAMQDPGLIILPTHRVVAADGLDAFYLEGFREAAGWHIARSSIPSSVAIRSIRLEQDLPGRLRPACHGRL